MPTIPLDLSGLGGLANKYHGDVHSSSSQPQLRYLVGQNQYTSGMWNPFRSHGYTSPTNKSIIPTSGPMTTMITSGDYDSINDVLYVAEAGVDGTVNTVIQQLDGLDDLSLTSTSTSNSMERIVDTELYQLNGRRSLLVVYDRGLSYGSWTVGFINIDADSGPALLESLVVDSGLNSTAESFGDVGTTDKLAQRIEGYDAGGSVRKIRLRLDGVITGSPFDMQVTIQTDSAGVPSGTVVGSATATASSTNLRTASREGTDVYFDFGSTISLSFGTTYWIVLTVATLSDMGSNIVQWRRTQGNQTLYANGEIYQYDSGAWSLINATESFDFSMISASDSNWWTEDATGTYDGIYPNSDTGTSFLQTADNGYCYWFTGNTVHQLDGGLSGGQLGTIVEDVLIFPKYLQCVDAIDTNGLMYIAVNTGALTGSTNTRSYTENIAGVYVWDRQTTIVRTRDFIPLIGVKEVRKLYQTREGVIRIICINNDRQVEIRQMSNGVFTPIETLGIDAFPPYRDSLKVLNNYVIWLGNDGKVYVHGQPTPKDQEALFIIGDLSVNASGAFTAGVIFVGNEPASGQEQAIYFSWKDGSTPKLSKWYPHGTGTINSVAQVGAQGDVYSPVFYLPTLADVRNLTIYCIPGTTSDSTTVATVKLYFNQSTTAGMTKTITKADVKKGYIPIQINKSYINAIQIEIEYSTSVTLGDDDFRPSAAVLEYYPTGTQAPTIS